jgi:hypothetical protein
MSRVESARIWPPESPHLDRNILCHSCALEQPRKLLRSIGDVGPLGEVSDEAVTGQRLARTDRNLMIRIG